MRRTEKTDVIFCYLHSQLSLFRITFQYNVEQRYYLTVVFAICCIGKQMFSYQAIDLWHDIPHYLRDLNTFSSAKEVKHYLPSEQYSKKFK